MSLNLTNQQNFQSLLETYEKAYGLYNSSQASNISCSDSESKRQQWNPPSEKGSNSMNNSFDTAKQESNGQEKSSETLKA